MAIDIVSPNNQPSTHDSTSSQPLPIVQEVYVPCPPTYTAASVAACASLEGIATVLAGQWEHLLPHQAAQLLERALEDCRPFVPAELREQLTTIIDHALRVRTQFACEHTANGGPVA